MNLPFSRKKADWVKLLEVMYEEQMYAEIDFFAKTDIQGSINKDNLMNTLTLPDMAGMSEEEVTKSLKYLRHMGLAEKDTTLEEPVYGLTQNGLRLAHQTKLERQQQKTNLILVVLTVVLVVLTGFLIGVEIFAIPAISL